MKRFFSFLCAAMLVLSTTAAPQFKSFKPAAQPNKLLAVKAQKPSAKKTAVPFKMAAKKQLLEQVSVRKAAKAPKAKQAVYNVTIGSYGSQDYGSGNIYYALISDDEVYRFDFDFYLDDATATDITPGVTYTLADLGDGEYSYITNQSTDDYYEYAAVSFLKTIVNDKVHFDVTITDTEGNTWNLTYAEPDVPQGGTYVADQVSSKYYSSTGDVQYILEATNDNLKFSFDIYVSANDKDVISGQTYTIDDMDAQYTWASYKGVSIDVDSASFTKTVAADGSYTIVASVKDTKGNTWNISASKAAPSVISQTLTLNGFAQAGSSYSQIEAANADSTILVSLLLYSSSLEGTFTEEDLITFYSLSYVLYGGVEYDIESADITIAYSEQAAAYLVSGTLNCVDPEDETNQAIFTLALTCEGDAPTAPSTMTLNIQVTDSSIIVTPSENGKWDWYMISQDDLDQYYGGSVKSLAQAAYNYYGDDDAKSGEYEFLFSNWQDAAYPAGEWIFIAYGCNNGTADPVDSALFVLPEKKYVSDMTFSFQANDSSIIVIPSNNEELWDCYLLDSATYSYNCGNNPDFVASVIYGNNGVKNANKGSVSISIEQLVNAGYSGRVIIIAWGCDSNQVTTKAAEFAFTLPKKVSDMTFQFQPFDGGVTVIPSNDEDPWDLAIITASTFASVDNDADYVAEYFYSENGDENALPGEYDLEFAEFGVTEDGDYVLIVWGADGGVTTPAAVYTFSIGGTTAIENADAAVKAVKVIRNGQLLIEKGNALFNANGVLVK